MDAFRFALSGAYRLALRRLVEWGLSVFGFSTAHVYRDRHALATAFPAKSVFTTKGEILGYWLSGLVLDEVPEDQHSISRLIFPHPDNVSVQVLSESFRDQPDWGANIKRMTKKARRMGIEVRWTRQIQGVGITIRRHGRRGWIQYEPMIPHSRPYFRPIFRMTERADKKVFAAVLEAFEALWENSEKPETALLPPSSSVSQQARVNPDTGYLEFGPAEPSDSDDSR